jgi:hypothetical protein
VELISSLLGLKNIVGFVGIDNPKSPAVLPAKSPHLASVILWGFVAEASDVVSSSGVNGDAPKIINGVSVAEDNISIRIASAVLRRALNDHIREQMKAHRTYIFPRLNHKGTFSPLFPSLSIQYFLCHRSHSPEPPRSGSS